MLCRLAGMKEPRRFFPLRSARFRLQRYLGWMALSYSRVTLGASVCAYGMPIISMCAGSECYVGEGSLLISVSFATALGVNHPVILRTLCPGAVIVIGKRVGISGGAICAAHRIQIGDDTQLGANVTVADTDFHSLNPYYRSRHIGELVGTRDVIIGKRVFVGTNTTVLKGATIGDNSVVGAGSVVTGHIPENVIAAGNPCRVLRHLTTEELRQ